MRTLIYIMTPVLILTFLFASRFVSWDRLKSVDTEAEKHLNIASQFLRNGKYHQAIKKLTQAIEIEPRYAQAYIQRGRANYHLTRYNEAIEDYTKTLSFKRYVADAHASRGDVYHALGDIPRAISDYTASIKKRKNALVMSKRAQSFLETGKLDEALADYNYIIKRRPSAIAYYNRGRAYYQKFLRIHEAEETVKLALSDFDKAIELAPQFAIAYLSRGDVYNHIGQQKSKDEDYAKAIDLLTDAIEKWQKDVDGLLTIYLWRALAYKKQDYDEAAETDLKNVYSLYTQFFLKKLKVSDIL